MMTDISWCLPRIRDASCRPVKLSYKNLVILHHNHHPIYLAMRLLRSLWHQIPTVYSLVQKVKCSLSTTHPWLREIITIFFGHSNWSHHMWTWKESCMTDQHSDTSARAYSKISADIHQLFSKGTETWQSREGKAPTRSAPAFCTK